MKPRELWSAQCAHCHKWLGPADDESGREILAFETEQELRSAMYGFHEFDGALYHEWCLREVPHPHNYHPKRNAEPGWGNYCTLCGQLEPGSRSEEWIEWDRNLKASTDAMNARWIEALSKPPEPVTQTVTFVYTVGATPEESMVTATIETRDDD